MPEQTLKRTYWVAAAFYLLIVFEFLYMASPFALYFYSLYKPGLNLFSSIPALAWLPRFFLPHLVLQTTSPVIDLHNVAGVVLTTLGLLGFVYGAVQVYYAKLAKKGVVTRGVYNYVRHPQYTSLIICGLGLLLLWPRYIVLVFYITMLFAYFLLARIEEKECEFKFGRPYTIYKEKTGMFFPIRFSGIMRLPSLPSTKWARILVCLIFYLLVMTGGMGVAKLLENHSRNSLYAYYTENAVTISITEIDAAKMQKLIQAALDEPTVRSRLAAHDPGLRLLNYIVPSNVSISEIPMHVFEGQGGNHFLLTSGDTEIYKIIFTKAILSGDGRAINEEILERVIGRIPLIEVWLRSDDRAVLQVYDPPIKRNYEGIPMPVY